MTQVAANQSRRNTLIFKKSIASVVSAALLVAGPGHMTLTASAQAVSRAAAAGVTVIPAIGAGLNIPIPIASSNMLSLVPSALNFPALLAAPSALTNGEKTPAVAAPSAAVPAAAKPTLATTLLPAAVVGSPFSVIESRDPSVGVSEKAAALDAAFENSIRSSGSDRDQDRRPEKRLQILKRLRREGYVTIPGFIGRERERRILRALNRRDDKIDGARQPAIHLLDNAGGSPLDWDHNIQDIGAMRSGRGGIKDLVKQLTRQLKKTLPKEKFELHRVLMHAIENSVPAVPQLHVDKFYITMTYVFGEKEPTLVYERGTDGKVAVRPVPPGSALLITARFREAVTGIPATIHSSPPVKVKRRYLLQVVYRTAGPVRMPERIRKTINGRVRSMAREIGAPYFYYPKLPTSAWWRFTGHRVHGSPLGANRPKRF